MQTLKALLVLVTSISFAAAPFWSDFNGFDPSLYPNPQQNPPIQPAGYAFAIWGLIYLALIAHAGFGVIARRDDEGWDRTRWPLILSLGIGTFWLMVAETSPIWATILIWAMLISALASLYRGSAALPGWIGSVPLGLYAGWLSAASWVSLGLLGAGYGIGFGEVVWGYIILALALAFIVAQLRALGWSPGYGAAAIWATIGIMVANWGTSWGMVALGGIGVLILLAQLWLSRRV